MTNFGGRDVIILSLPPTSARSDTSVCRKRAVPGPAALALLGDGHAGVVCHIEGNDARAFGD